MTDLNLAGHPYSSRDLVRRAVLNLASSSQLGIPRWALVRDTFAVGSTVAIALCQEFDLDPDVIIKKVRS